MTRNDDPDCGGLAVGRRCAIWAQRPGPPVRHRPSLSSGAVPTARQRAIIARVRAIPPGFVRSYGDVSPGAPRVAGATLHGCEDPSVPWHRVVRSDGSLAKGTRQRRLLEAEGVPFRGSRVDMRVVRIPEEAQL